MLQNKEWFQYLVQMLSMIFFSFTYMVFIYENTQELHMRNIAEDSRIHRKFILPKYHATVNQIKPADKISFDNFKIEYGDYEDYTFGEEIGSGASGTAYHGIKKSTGEKVIIKTFLKTKMKSIRKEISLLKAVEGHKNIVGLYDVIYNDFSKALSLVFIYLQSEPTSDLFLTTTDKGNKFFLYQILKAIAYTHSNGVIHGDIKPLNIIASPKTRMLKLIDWGLGNFYLPGKAFSFRIGTKSYKAPELLLHYSYYDYQVDVFSAGLIFSKMLFRKGPFFDFKREGDEEDEFYLMRLTKVLGTRDLIAYAEKYQMDYNFTTPQWDQIYSRQNLTKYANEKNGKYCSPDGLDLLEKMLIYDHNERITAKDALEHPYFDQVRDKM